MKSSRSSDVLNGRVGRWFADTYGCYEVGSAVRRLVRQLLLDSEQSHPPVGLSGIAAQRGVVRTTYESSIRSCARLVPTSQGFTIALQADASWFIRREWWAHEIAHTFFFDVDSRPPRRLVNGNGSEEEAICNMLGRELLVPSDFLRDALATARPSLLELNRLQRLFQVSFATLAERVLRGLARWEAIILWCEDREHLFPRSKHVNRPQSRLRIVRRLTPMTKGSFVPLNKSVDTVPVIRDAYRQGRFVEGEVTLDRLGDIRGRVRVEAMPVPRAPGERECVVALLDLSEPVAEAAPPSPVQAQLFET